MVSLLPRVYIVHYRKLHERKESILRQLEKHHITDYEFVDIDRDEVDNFDTKNMDRTVLNDAQVAIFLSHLAIFEKIRDDPGQEEGLILEDDVLLHENFKDIFSAYRQELPSDYDMLFLGNGCDLHVSPTSPDKHIYLKCPPWEGDITASRCTDSYLVHKKCAIAMLDAFHHSPSPIRVANDHWLNNVTRDHKLVVYWAEPTIATQGTQCGVFPFSYSR
jgi:GR25 family glycosyltransferase involved in LPS biosynthesis